MRNLLIAVFLTIAAALLGLWVSFQLHPWDHMAAANDEVGNYLQTVGTIYAVVLAFVVFVVWSQFNEASSFVYREANELGDLHRVIGELPDPVRVAALDRVRAYTDAVIEEEWLDMEHGRECERARGHLEEVWQSLRPFDPCTQREQILYAEALSRFNDLSDARVDRLRCSRTKLPSVIWLLMGSGAFVIICSLYLLKMESHLLQAILTAAMAGALSHVLYLVYDLDNCFSGYWQVRKDPFLRVRKHM